MSLCDTCGVPLPWGSPTFGKQLREVAIKGRFSLGASINSKFKILMVLGRSVENTLRYQM
jgi:hypothetical protein